jgi:hypothetical protein
MKRASPRTGNSGIFRFFLGLLPFVWLATAQADLGNGSDSTLDPQTTTLERRENKLYIHIRQPDGSIKEVVKELEEIKPGTTFSHWTTDPGSLEWMRTGKYPEANLDPLLTPTGHLQMFGPGFYASANPVDSSTYGDILTQFDVPARPQGLLSRFEKKPAESFWVLKEELNFGDATPEELKRRAMQTYPLLKKAGIAGCRVTGTWYTFFDKDALTGFHPVRPQDILGLSTDENFTSHLLQAIGKLHTIPQNAPTWNAISAEISKEVEEAKSLDDLSGLMGLSYRFNSQALNQAIRKRILELLPKLPAEFPSDTFSTSIMDWAANKNDLDLVNQLIDQFIRTHAKPFEDTNFRSSLASLYHSTDSPEMEKAILARLKTAVENAKTTTEMHHLYSGIRFVRDKDFRETYANRLSALVQAGDYGTGYAAEWADVIAATEQAHPALLSALANEVARPSANWADSTFQRAILNVLQKSQSQELKDGVLKGVNSALGSIPQFGYVIDFAKELKDPRIDAGLKDYIRALMGEITEADTRRVDSIFLWYGNLNKRDPAFLKEMLSTLASRIKTNNLFDSTLVDQSVHALCLYVTKLPEGQERNDALSLTRAFFGKLQTIAPAGQNIANNANWGALVKALQPVMGLKEGDDFSRFAGDLEPKGGDGSCAAGFKAAGGQ